MIKTTSAEFFESLYRRNPDPWDFESSVYETSRYAATIKALEGRRFRRALEAGCSIGVLTAKLALLADQVEAFDISPTAVKQAQYRCSAFPNIRIFVSSIEDNFVGEDFDLIVLSEIGYYFPEADLLRITKQLAARLRLNGTLLAVHWLGSSADHVLSGDRVHELLHTLPGLTHELGEREPAFRLDGWRKG